MKIIGNSEIFWILPLFSQDFLRDFPLLSFPTLLVCPFPMICITLDKSLSPSDNNSIISTSVMFVPDSLMLGSLEEYVFSFHESLREVECSFLGFVGKLICSFFASGFSSAFFSNFFGLPISDGASVIKRGFLDLIFSDSAAEFGSINRPRLTISFWFSS